MNKIVLQPLDDTTSDWVARVAAEHWGSDMMVSRGKVYYVSRLPGFVALDGAERIGLITYQIEGDACEVGSLDSFREGQGVGTALIEAVAEVARQAGCRRLWLITTNDNIDALRFYQKRDFTLVAVHRNAVNQARMIKHEIAMIGNYGIPIRDEIELELEL